MTEPALDPRWDWTEIRSWGGDASRWIRGACRHLEVVPVEDVNGAVVAQLCRTCDQQFPPPSETT